MSTTRCQPSVCVCVLTLSRLVFHIFFIWIARRCGHKVCMCWAAAVAYTLIVSSFLSMRDARSDLVDDRFGSLSTRYHVNWFFCLTRFFPIFSSSPSANVLKPTSNGCLRQLRECSHMNLQNKNKWIDAFKCAVHTMHRDHWPIDTKMSRTFGFRPVRRPMNTCTLDSPHRFDIFGVRECVRLSNRPMYVYQRRDGIEKYARAPFTLN